MLDSNEEQIRIDKSNILLLGPTGSGRLLKWIFFTVNLLSVTVRQPRTCELRTVLPSSSFPEAYNVPCFKSKANKLSPFLCSLAHSFYCCRLCYRPHGFPIINYENENDSIVCYNISFISIMTISIISIKLAKIRHNVKHNQTLLCNVKEIFKIAKVDGLFRFIEILYILNLDE